MPTTRQRSDAQEGRVAALFGGRKNPNSGAVNNIALKGDVRTDTHVIECKCTTKSSRSVSLGDLRKAKREAQNIGKDYFLDIEFQGSEWENEVFGAVCVVDRNDFAEILENHQKWQKIDHTIDAVQLVKYLNRYLSKDTKLELALAIRKCSELTKIRDDLGIALL